MLTWGGLATQNTTPKVRVKSVYCDVVEKDACEKSTREMLAKMARDNNTELPEAKKVPLEEDMDTDAG